MEKEKSVILQAKINNLNRELEVLKERNGEMLEEKANKSNESSSLNQQLKAEKEKALILSAKYNTLNNKFEKERNELLQKMQILEKLVSEQQQQAQIASPPRRIYQ